jgi:aminopeptidase N
VADFPRLTAMLAWQLDHDPDVLGRIEAIDALASRVETEGEARSALARAARRDTLWMVRSRALAALGPMVKSDSVRAVVLSGTRDSDTRVRETAAATLANAVGHQDAADRLRSLAQGDRSWWVRAAAIRALADVDSALAIDVARDVLRREEWRDIARVAALEALARIRSDEAKTLIIEQLDDGERQGRVAAINALVTHAVPADSGTALVLEGLLDDGDPFLRIAAAAALGRVGIRASVQALQARRAKEEEPRVRLALDQAIRRLGS